VHDADLLRFILGDEPESVAAFSQNGGPVALDHHNYYVSGVRAFHDPCAASAVRRRAGKMDWFRWRRRSPFSKARDGQAVAVRLDA